MIYNIHMIFLNFLLHWQSSYNFPFSSRNSHPTSRNFPKCAFRRIWLTNVLSLLQNTGVIYIYEKKSLLLRSLAKIFIIVIFSIKPVKYKLGELQKTLIISNKSSLTLRRPLRRKLQMR